jgi:5'-3' exonuclease
MYRNQAQDDLIGGMYAMISLLEHYGVELYFVFDGIPPSEKSGTLEERKTQREFALSELAYLEGIVSDVSATEKKHRFARIQRLRRQCARLNEMDIALVKELLTYLGVGYMTADGEAERLCAKLVIRNIADACLSDDTDMFVYGCPRILRYLSVLGETVIHYDCAAMLKDIGISQRDFRSVCVAAGTDYNQATHGFGEIICEYGKFRDSGSIEQFADWLVANNNQISDECAFWTVYLMYDLADVTVPKCLHRRGARRLGNPPQRDPDALRAMLSNYNFFFA